MPGIVDDRPVGYDPNLFWDEESAWVASRSLDKTGGGRMRDCLVVISEQGKIYVGGIE